jgi:hypothetical protein
MWRWIPVALGIFMPTLATAHAAPSRRRIVHVRGPLILSPTDPKIVERGRTQPGLLLTLHVTYWNYLGLTRPFLPRRRDNPSAAACGARDGRKSLHATSNCRWRTGRYQLGRRCGHRVLQANRARARCSNLSSTQHADDKHYSELSVGRPNSNLPALAPPLGCWQLTRRFSDCNIDLSLSACRPQQGSHSSASK